MDMKESLQKINQRIKSACKDSKKDPSKIKLLAVSKGQSIEKIKNLYDLGLRYFGESYCEELIEKAHKLPKDINWSFIGKLQSNKIKKILTVSNEIQSVSSQKHIRYIVKYAQQLNKTPFPFFSF